MENKKYSLLSVGFIATLISMVCLVIAFFYYKAAFATFQYKEDKSVVACTFIALWLLLVLLITGLLDKKRPWFVTIVYVVLPLLIAYAFIRLLMPSLTVIGTYFSPAGEAMGDVETNRVGVPQTIYGAVFYVVAVIALVISSFSDIWREKKPAKVDANGNKVPSKISVLFSNVKSKFSKSDKKEEK